MVNLYNSETVRQNIEKVQKCFCFESKEQTPRKGLALGGKILENS